MEKLLPWLLTPAFKPLSRPVWIVELESARQKIRINLWFNLSDPTFEEFHLLICKSMFHLVFVLAQARCCSCLWVPFLSSGNLGRFDPTRPGRNVRQRPFFYYGAGGCPLFNDASAYFWFSIAGKIPSMAASTMPGGLLVG